MSTDDELALLRESIREKLQAQRRVIAAQLLPAPGAAGRFPRSMTMRLLIQRPDLLGKAALGLLRRLRR